MKRSLLTGLLLCSLPAGRTSAAEPAGPPPIVVRAAITPEAPIWIGQRVILQLDVLSSDGWAKAKQVRDVELPGVHVMRPDGQGIRLQETLEGVSYTGQRQEVSLYPRRAGRVDVPSFPVDVEIVRWGAGGSNQVERHQSPPLTFDVSVPPGAEAMTGLITTPKLTAQQSWSPEPQQFKAGDALTRTVTLEADDVSGMAFEPLVEAPIAGVGRYPETPSVEDQADRGSLTGRRIEKVTYLFERPGDVVLPPIELTWFNPVTRKLTREVLDGLELNILPNPALAETPAISPAQRRGVWIGAILLAVLIALGIRRITPRLRTDWHAWRQRVHASEAASFRRVRQAARRGDPTATLNAVLGWLDRTRAAPGLSRLDTFSAECGTEQLRSESAALLHAATGDDAADWDSHRWMAALIAARRAREHSRKRAQRAYNRLPPLNGTHLH